jgi:hypothetical protein
LQAAELVGALASRVTVNDDGEELADPFEAVTWYEPAAVAADVHV